MNFWQALLKVEAYGLVYMLYALALTLILSFIIPQALKKKYLQPPYFSRGEVLLLTAFPKRMALGCHFCFMVVIPKLGKKRGLDKAFLDAPQWWKYLSYFYFYLAFVPMMFWLLGAIVFFIHTKLAGT